ncbi:MAG: hypothetical protein RR313_11145 [Anaerovoracaceae bacterium]
MDDTYCAVQAKTMRDALHIAYGKTLPDEMYYSVGLIDFSKNDGVFVVCNCPNLK